MMSIDPISNFNVDMSADGDTYKASITTHIIQQIVAEEDEYTLNMIEEYVKSKKAKGECVAAKIIPEGKLRHIINLGISVYNKCNNCKITAAELFPEQQYIEFLRNEMLKLEYENQRLRNEIKFGGGTDEE